MPDEPHLRVTRRRLPHWTVEGSVYFVTFRTVRGELTPLERQIVFDHVLEGTTKFYRLFALVVMPDHVHLALRPNKGLELSRIMKGIKGVSARKINRLRQQHDSVWQDESFDRIIRDDDEFMQKLEYIQNNPMKAGLVSDSSLYPFLFLDADLGSADRNVCLTN